MSPTKDSTVLAVRVRNQTLAEIKKKKRKKTLNAWLNWCIGLGLRKHDKKEE